MTASIGMLPGQLAVPETGIDDMPGGAEERAALSRVLFSSQSTEHTTPEVVLELVRRVAPIGLDPCWNPRALTGSPVYADHDFRAFTAADDGLSQPWVGHGLAFVNPPYGRRQIGRWVERCATADHAIALVPARTDTRWWHDHAISASCIAFWRGRLRFGNAPASAPFPSAVLYWPPAEKYAGHTPPQWTERFRDAFRAAAWVTRRP